MILEKVSVRSVDSITPEKNFMDFRARVRLADSSVVLERDVFMRGGAVSLNPLLSFFPFPLVVVHL